MSLEARVKESYKLGAVTAFSGNEYTQNEWRPVPVEAEDQAIVHPYLDVREVGTEKPIKVTSQDYLSEATTKANESIYAPHSEELGEPEMTSDDSESESSDETDETKSVTKKKGKPRK